MHSLAIVAEGAATIASALSKKEADAGSHRQAIECS